MPKRNATGAFAFLAISMPAMIDVGLALPPWFHSTIVSVGLTPLGT
jgi:hypothetical protein